MGEKGFSQSGWRETDHQLNLQRNPTSSVLKPRRKGGMWCFRMLLLGDSFDTRWEKQAARLGFFQVFVGICTLILQEKIVEKVFQNWRFCFMISLSNLWRIVFWIFLNVPSWLGKPILDHQICEAPICQGRDFAAHRHLALQMVLLSAALSRRWTPKRMRGVKWDPSEWP